MPSQDEKYEILLTDEALVAIKRLDGAVRERIKRKLEALCTLRPSRTLKKHPNIWVLEIGDYRALYLIDKAARTRTVFFMGSHKEYEKKYLQMF